MPFSLSRLGALALVALSLGACGRFPTASIDPSTRLSERDCLARAMYFESNRSSEDGMAAVGTVVMNRVQSNRYPKSVCGVVGQKNQFAEGALSKPVSSRSWALASRVADEVLAGRRHSGVGAAQHFHTVGYSYPYRNMRYVTLAGGNIFYEKRYPTPGAPAWPSSSQFASRFGAPVSRPVAFAEARPDRAETPIAVASLESARGGAEPQRAERRPAAPRPSRRVMVAAGEGPVSARPAPVPSARVATGPVRATTGPGGLGQPPARPIVVAMLDARKPARPGRPRSIAELIEMAD